MKKTLMTILISLVLTGFAFGADPYGGKIPNLPSPNYLSYTEYIPCYDEDGLADDTLFIVAFGYTFDEPELFAAVFYTNEDFDNSELENPFVLILGTPGDDDNTTVFVRLGGKVTRMQGFTKFLEKYQDMCDTLRKQDL